RYVAEGFSEEEAFDQACESITGPISHAISRDGILSVYERLQGGERREFDRAYVSTYGAVKGLMAEIYDEVASGNEIRSVVMAGQRLKQYPMGEIDGSRMWNVGAAVRKARDRHRTEVHPFTAGVFCGAMMAQIDLLLDRGHPYSEIANESVIE